MCRPANTYIYRLVHTALLARVPAVLLVLNVEGVRIEQRTCQGIQPGVKCPAHRQRVAAGLGQLDSVEEDDAILVRRPDDARAVRARADATEVCDRTVITR